MAARKSYMAPFWMMIILLVVVIGYYVFLYVWLNSYAFQEVIRKQAWVWATYIGILLVETIVYFFLRKMKIRRLLIWSHVGALWFSFVVIPLVFGIIQVFQSMNYSAEEFRSAGIMLQRIRFVLFWSAMAIGHIFFVAAIVNGFRRKGSSDTDDDEMERAFT